jgi:hypothetical protein
MRAAHLDALVFMESPPLGFEIRLLHPDTLVMAARIFKR